MNKYKARKVGHALKQQKAMEGKYDVEDSFGTPQRLMEWINKCLDGEHKPCTESTWRVFGFFLRDGTALCKLINKLRAADGLSAVKYANNAATAFIAMDNIKHFNQAAVEYGVESSAAFDSSDLYDGQKGALLNVISCLDKLGFVANSKGYQPAYEAVERPPQNAEGSAAT